jgi:hypothetical protein
VPDTLVVEGDETGAGVTPAEVSAHTAAVAEGMTAVQAADAAESAAAAAAAAEVALLAAEENAKTAETVIEATAQAETSAAAAGISAEMVMDALKAQTAILTEVREELKASRKAAMPADPPRRAAPDAEPGNGGRKGATWTRR